MRRFLVLGALLFALPAHAVTMEWVRVGDPGNLCDWEDFLPEIGCFGAVAEPYLIGKYEVTNAQYTEFLNAVADYDAHDLYHVGMGSSEFGGITRSGSLGSYTYSTIPGREDWPVNLVDFWDALRFANWLHNGQGSGDTEAGAYTMTFNGMPITRNADATFFLPSEDEWYKAAYYDSSLSGGLGGYFDYPAGTDAQTICSSPTSAANHANCDQAVGWYPTDVGSYTGSASPYGTFDQGGNVLEWNETIIETYPPGPGHTRGVRGGSFIFPPFTFEASFSLRDQDPYGSGEIIGFRVARIIPEPSTALLLAAGLAGLAGAGRRRFLQ